MTLLEMCGIMEDERVAMWVAIQYYFNVLCVEGWKMILEDKSLCCKDCDTVFLLTAGEQEFYAEKGFSEPQRCKTCRTAKRKNINLRKSFATTYAECNCNNDLIKLHSKIKEWSVEAKDEESAYFYNVKEAELISNGKKSFVIGRKGSGKTAIARHLIESEHADTFSIPLSFKDFPFEIIYSLSNSKEYTIPNQYVSIWKYLIYTCVCKKMIENEAIDVDVRSKLSQLYCGNSSVDRLDRLLKKYTTRSFGVQALSIGFEYERESCNSEENWLDTLEVLQGVIFDSCDSSKYFIVIDELDEALSSSEEGSNYMDMLTSLFKAVQNIRRTFNNSRKHIYPVVFLRSDIYDRIRDSDKNKWYENIINLEWNRIEIQRMLTHRFCVALEQSHINVEFPAVWYRLFENKKVSAGNRQSNPMEIYSFIERSTEMRPRDFIQYIKLCVDSSDGVRLIKPHAVKNADENFSEYLKRETIDEVFAILPEIDEILGLLSTIGKQSFQFSTFEEEYDSLVERGEVTKRDVRKILLTLFEVGVIGNDLSMRGKTSFKFSGKGTPRFDYNKTMLVHRGLFKALQIY